MLKKILLALSVLAALSTGSALAQDANQQLAQAVAQKLSASGKLSGYQIDIQVIDGKVAIQGMVHDADQASEISRLTQSVAGVSSVDNQLSIRGMIKQSSMQEQVRPPQVAAPAAPAWAANEPIPSFSAGGGGPGFQQPAPPLPPYAWPTYAPYNNFSRVGYPVCYPADAMPFIGPFNPFPRAPLGWRHATLSFDDGHWYLSSHAGNRDWWTVKFW